MLDLHKLEKQNVGLVLYRYYLGGFFLLKKTKQEGEEFTVITLCIYLEYSNAIEKKFFVRDLYYII